ncbi:MAG: hypothetical protein VKL60_10145 [Sphaerospermopsis sp.]|nr:hypothetical protein [Sphaerospermopsis sp.]
MLNLDRSCDHEGKELTQQQKSGSCWDYSEFQVNEPRFLFRAKGEGNQNLV